MGIYLSLMLIDYKELKHQFGGTHPAEVAARLERANVPFILGKMGRPFTTETALNHAMGITQQHQLPELEVSPTIKVL